MTACTACGATPAPFHWQRPTPLASLPPAKRGMLHACVADACREAMDARWRAVLEAEGYGPPPGAPAAPRRTAAEAREAPTGDPTPAIEQPRQMALL